MLNATGETQVALQPNGTSYINTGNIGIGTTTPASPLAVNRQANDGVVIDIEQADTVEGTISVSGTTVSYNAFLGSHYTQLKQGQQELPVGAVVISTGEIVPCEVTIIKETKTEVTSIEAIVVAEEKDTETGAVTKEEELAAGITKEGEKYFETVSEEFSPDVSGVEKKEYFPYIDVTSKPADKRVYGVWVGKMSNNSEGQSFGQDALPIYLVGQVGLFKIRVTDTNGDIENGDFLETSERKMEAQKQTDSGRSNSTIAKAMVDVDWTQVAIDPVLGYKWKLIPCIF